MSASEHRLLLIAGRSGSGPAGAKYKTAPEAQATGLNAAGFLRIYEQLRAAFLFALVQDSPALISKTVFPIAIRRSP